jgi:hypothetical protein
MCRRVEARQVAAAQHAVEEDDRGRCPAEAPGHVRHRLLDPRPHVVGAAVERAHLEDQRHRVVLRERQRPCLEQLLPALAFGEVEVREEDLAAGLGAQVEWLDARREPVEIQRAAHHPHPRGRDPAAAERLDVERARDPDLVALEQRTEPAGRQAVGLEHRARDVDPLGVRRLRAAGR